MLISFSKRDTMPFVILKTSVVQIDRGLLCFSALCPRKTCLTYGIIKEKIWTIDSIIRYLLWQF